MFFISKKRLNIIIGIFVLCIFSCVFINNNNELNNNVSVPTVAYPVTNKVIVIDAGHGKPDEGAQSSNRYD